MKVGVISPTLPCMVEKLATIFYEGIEVVGQLPDDRHYWNDYRFRTKEWEELGLKITVNIKPYSEINFSKYDLIIHFVETFFYTKDWIYYCHKIKCPLLLIVIWTKVPSLLPPHYLETVKNFPVIVQFPSHYKIWQQSNFSDVNLIFNPAGEWWFQKEWDGKEEKILGVLSGAKSWRDNPYQLGFKLWEEISKVFPDKTYLHDGHESYKTTRELVKLFSESRVFVNFDLPFGQGERTLTLAFTEALSVGLPVVARDLSGLDYKQFIDKNGICSNNFNEICVFIEKCLNDFSFAGECSKRSKEIAKQNFSLEVLRPKYMEVVKRAQGLFKNKKVISTKNFNFFNEVKKDKDIFEKLSNYFIAKCPAEYNLKESVNKFYSDASYWEKFKEYESSLESYTIRDRKFVNHILKMDGANIINIGCHYPWAEIEWGNKVNKWIVVDINEWVLKKAREILANYSSHKVFFIKADITNTLNLKEKFSCVLDLSTFDHLHPGKYKTVLKNYKNLADFFILAYDATKESPYIVDFEDCVFRVYFNPITMVELLENAGYEIIEHRPHAYYYRSYVYAKKKG